MDWLSVPLKWLYLDVLLDCSAGSTPGVFCCVVIQSLFHILRFLFSASRWEDGAALTSCPSLPFAATALWSNDHILCFVCFYCLSTLSSVQRRGLFKAATLLPNMRGKVFPTCLACWMHHVSIETKHTRANVCFRWMPYSHESTRVLIMEENKTKQNTKTAANACTLFTVHHQRRLLENFRKSTTVCASRK